MPSPMCLFCPSHSEGSPNVLLEAMDAGVPIVATLVGGIPEIVTNDQDALLVESHDVAGMAAAMVRLLSDEELCTRLTAAARTVLERHTPEIYFKNIMSVLSRGCGKVRRMPDSRAKQIYPFPIDRHGWASQGYAAIIAETLSTRVHTQRSITWQTFRLPPSSWLSISWRGMW